MTKFKGIASHLLCLILLLLIVSHNTSSNYYRQNLAMKQTFDGNIKVIYHHCVMYCGVAEIWLFQTFRLLYVLKLKPFIFYYKNGEIWHVGSSQGEWELIHD